jgi:hypothetical protein
LQRFLQLAFAYLLGLEEPRILDGYDSLFGERLNERDLAFGKWLDPAARQNDDARDGAFA